MKNAQNGEQWVIRIDGASLDFGYGAGVFDLSFQLGPGTILDLIGPSGICVFEHDGHRF